MIGEEIPEDYGAFLEGELSLNGEDPFVPPGVDDLPEDKRRDFRVLIIGAGMSGLLAAHRLSRGGGFVCCGGEECRCGWDMAGEYVSRMPR